MCRCWPNMACCSRNEGLALNRWAPWCQYGLDPKPSQGEASTVELSLCACIHADRRWESPLVMVTQLPPVVRTGFGRGEMDHQWGSLVPATAAITATSNPTRLATMSRRIPLRRARDDLVKQQERHALMRAGTTLQAPCFSGRACAPLGTGSRALLARKQPVRALPPLVFPVSRVRGGAHGRR